MKNHQIAIFRSERWVIECLTLVVDLSTFNAAESGEENDRPLSGTTLAMSDGTSCQPQRLEALLTMLSDNERPTQGRVKFIQSRRKQKRQSC
jgi:hypothetical protein